MIDCVSRLTTTRGRRPWPCHVDGVSKEVCRGPRASGGTVACEARVARVIGLYGRLFAPLLLRVQLLYSQSPPSVNEPFRLRTSGSMRVVTGDI